MLWAGLHPWRRVVGPLWARGPLLVIGLVLGPVLPVTATVLLLMVGWPTGLPGRGYFVWLSGRGWPVRVARCGHFRSPLVRAWRHHPVGARWRLLLAHLVHHREHLAVAQVFPAALALPAPDQPVGH